MESGFLTVRRYSDMTRVPYQEIVYVRHVLRTSEITTLNLGIIKDNRGLKEIHGQLGNVSEWFFHEILLSPAAPVWARKKQLPAAVKVMVDQGRVVAAYGCGGVIEGDEQVRTDIAYLGGIGL